MLVKQSATEIHRLRQAVVAHATGHTKTAELGGDGQDTNFEQAFSNLAHAYLRDKAPGLLDHEVGFQLLDRNQENTKAIGVFGFKVGSNWIYAPVFFLNGDLKGHELLYLKNQDMFCPLKENWLNYILNRKPNILGEGVDKDYRKSLLQPDLSQFSRSPAKFAAARPSLQAMVDAVMPKFAATALLDVPSTLAEAGKHVNLVSFLKTASAKQLHLFVATCQACPQLAREVERFHGADKIAAAVRTGLRAARVKAAGSILDPAPKPAPQILTGCILDVRPPHPIKTGALKVITHDLTQQTELPPDMDEEDQEKLMKDRVLIKDERKDDEVSKAYHVQVEQKLQNPTETGLYQVLTKTGEFERCLIIVHPLSADRKQKFVTVVRLDGEKNWCNTSDQVWVGSHLEDEWKEWFDGLPDAKSLSKGRSRHVIITPSKDATCPFSVEKEYGEEGNESKVYEVNFDDNDPGRLMRPFQEHQEYENDSLRYDRWRDGARIHLNGKLGSSLRSSRGDVFVPSTAKLLEVKHDAYDDEDHDDEPSGICGCSGSAGESDPSPIRPGSIVDAQLSIMQKTASLSIYHDGREVEINHRRMSPIDGLVSLVRDHGFREPAAREMLKQAAAKRKIAFRVKYASPYLTDSQPSAPSMPEPQMAGGNMMGADVPQQLPQHDFQQVDRPPTNPDIYNPNTTLDRREVDKIRGAARSGQKEIFDTAMVGSMLKAVRDDTMVDQYLGDLAKGMDRLGRILFMFYWHGDRFAERYGKSDMPELEDSLRNAFENNGDVLMFLKQKSIEPYPEENDVGADLGSASSG